ncbi:MAG TPA: class I adenylate-forming enzyme family protein [Amycolatopsis sp.]|nr:class I adenylate-forming enzyme family protein [Amycolatopsis sp.]
MNLTMLLDMVVEGMPDRVLIGDREDGLTGRDLGLRARGGADLIRAAGADTLVYLGGNGPTFPVALFAAAIAGVPFLPVNYRLSDEQLEDVLSRRAKPLVVSDSPERARGRASLTLAEFLAQTAIPAEHELEFDEIDPDSIAVLLMTSGTTAAPKSAVLRHKHLMSYIFGSVEFASAEETDATIVSVPPYHIAAVANLLSNLYASRRIVYLDRFTPADWLHRVRTQGVTQAMVVPTMLVRIVDELVRSGEQGPSTLRSISYGGAKIAAPVLVEALRLFPETGFVNAYGLTETASSIAVLGPDDHRDAVGSDDPDERARLGSVGRALPGVEIEVHDESGNPCPPGVVGSIVVRGPQVAGEYIEAGSRLDPDGWFPTRDLGYIDKDGFIFVQGRADDTIIRGGENIAPSEIEAVLVEHEWVEDVAVAGIPDQEWGQRIGAFVVVKPGVPADAESLREFVRGRLRSSKTPDDIVFLAELPTTPTGKVLRRKLVDTVTQGTETPTA